MTKSRLDSRDESTLDVRGSREASFIARATLPHARKASAGLLERAPLLRPDSRLSEAQVNGHQRSFNLSMDVQGRVNNTFKLLHRGKTSGLSN